MEWTLKTGERPDVATEYYCYTEDPVISAAVGTAVVGDTVLITFPEAGFQLNDIIFGLALPSQPPSAGQKARSRGRLPEISLKNTWLLRCFWAG